MTDFDRIFLDNINNLWTITATDCGITLYVWGEDSKSHYFYFDLDGKSL